MAEYLNPKTGKWESSEPVAETPVPEDGRGGLGGAWDYLSQAVPDAIDATGEAISNAGGAVADYAQIAYEGPKPGAGGFKMLGVTEQPQSDSAYQASIGKANFENSLAGKRAEILKRNAQETPNLKAFAIGAGHETDALVKGTQNILDSTPGVKQWMGGRERIQNRELKRKTNNEAYSYLQDSHPWMTGLGATAPYLAPGSRVTKLGGKVPGVRNLMKTPARKLFDLTKKVKSRGTREYLQKAIVGGKNIHNGARSGGLRKLPQTLADSPLANTVALGATVGAVHPDLTTGEGAFYAGAGYGLTKLAAGKFARPTNWNRKERNDILARLKDRGYDIDPGIRTGDKRMQQIDQAFGRNPDLAGPFREAKLKNQALDNLTVSKLVGEETTNMGGKWFARNRKNLSRSYDEIYNNLEATQSPAVRNDVLSVLKKYESDFGNINAQGKYNPNIDPIVKTYQSKIWDMFGHGKVVPMNKWKAVNEQIEARIQQYGKDPSKQHLVPYFQDYAKAMKSMVKGSKNKEFLGRLERADLKKAVLEQAAKNTDSGGNVNMVNLAERIQQKYNTPFTSGSTGNQNLDDYYDALKGALFRNSAEGASLGVSDRITKLFRNPIGTNAGRFGYLLSSGGQSPGAVSNVAIGAYRASPNLGLGPKIPGMLGEGVGRFQLSDR